MISDAELEILKADSIPAWPDKATILRNTSVNGAGGSSSDYLPVGTTICRLTTSLTTTPSEVEIAAELASVTHWMLNVPADTDIKPSDRVQVQGITFEVVGGYKAASWNISDTHILAEVQR